MPQLLDINKHTNKELYTIINIYGMYVPLGFACFYRLSFKGPFLVGFKLGAFYYSPLLLHLQFAASRSLDCFKQIAQMLSCHSYFPQERRYRYFLFMTS